MPSINQIVDVQISRETRPVAQAGFGTALIVGESAQAVFDGDEVVREYTSVADMITDGFLSSDPEYLSAVRLMGQANRPQKFLVGLVTIGASEETLTYTGTLTAGTVSVSINGRTITQDFLTDEVTTLDALATKIQADPDVTTATYTDADNTLVIASAGGDLAVTSLAHGNFTAAGITTSASTSSWGAELAAILEANSSWYALIPARYSNADALAAADFISAQGRIMGITVWDGSAVTGAASGLAYTLFNSNYDRVAVYYSHVYGENLAAASLGERLPTLPGSGTFKFKSLSGSPVSPLSSSQITAARTKNVNLFLRYGSTAILTEGVTASGEFLDTIIGTDWLTARIAENVFSRLANMQKIPYSDVGFAVVESAIREVLAAGVRNGIILDDPGLTVTVPKRVDISANDRANRILPDVKFTANLAGAVHAVTIRGTVSI